MLTTIFGLLAAQGAVIGSPAECRHQAMSVMTQGSWRYAVTVPAENGTLRNMLGEFRMQEVAPGVLEGTYPKEDRPGFRLTRTADGYRSTTIGDTAALSADVRVAECQGPDANGTFAILEVADREPSPNGEVASVGRVTATPRAIVLTISERPSGSDAAFAWAYTLFLYRAD